jgi:hypothetical protein
MRSAELLTGLSVEELEALADCLLAPASQARLDDLLARKKEQPLSAEEDAELDSLLKKTDQLTILKTRARYTLSQAKAEAARTRTSTSPSNSKGGFANASGTVVPIAERPSI